MFYEERRLEENETIWGVAPPQKLDQIKLLSI